jgi:fucose 4-O-acetylase-like acetyltransferase
MTLSAPIPLADAIPAARPRSAALDVARGIGIVLVVSGHAIIGVQGALGDAPPGRFAVTAIYAVHMPLFFFLSGLLSRSATAEPARAFALRMATRIVYPYLLWGAVILALHHAMSDLTNTRVDSLDFTKLLYRPPAVLWFLYVLFVCFLLARTLRGLPTPPRLALGAVLCLAGCLLESWLLPYLRFVGIFMIATALDPAALPALLRDRRILALASLGLASGLALALAAAATSLQGYPAAGLRYLPAAAGGIVLILAASYRIRAITPPFRSVSGATAPQSLRGFVRRPIRARLPALGQARFRAYPRQARADYHLTVPAAPPSASALTHSSRRSGATRCVASAGSGRSMAWLLAYLGARTMPIFVTHILILAAVRILLVRAAATDAAIIVALATPLALALPALAYDQADRLGLARALGWR